MDTRSSVLVLVAVFALPPAGCRDSSACDEDGDCGPVQQCVSGGCVVGDPPFDSAVGGDAASEADAAAGADASADGGGGGTDGGTGPDGGSCLPAEAPCLGTDVCCAGNVCGCPITPCGAAEMGTCVP